MNFNNTKKQSKKCEIEWGDTDVNSMYTNTCSARVPTAWKKTFAWIPVTVKNKRYWLKSMYKRKKFLSASGNTSITEYGDIFDLLSDS